MFICDADMRISHVNPAFERLTGYAREEAVGRSAAILHDNRRCKSLFNAMQHTVASGKPWHGRISIRRKDGTRRSIERTIAPVRDKKGNIICHVAICRDTTEHERIQAALRESEARYRSLVENMPDAIIVHCKGNIVFANKSAGEMLAADAPSSLVGTPVMRLIHPDDREMVKNRIRQALTQHAVQPLAEIRMQRLDGSDFIAQVVGTPVWYDKRRAVQAVFRDITSLKQKEEAILRLSAENSRLAQRLIMAGEREREHLARELHDELGQNLALIKTEIGRAATRTWNRPELAGVIRTIDATTDQVIAATRNMLQRLRPVMLDDIGLREALLALAEDWQQQHGIPCRFSAEGELDALHGDIPLALYRIMQEALTNVARHARAGRVDVCCRNRGEVTLCIRDNGLGLPEKRGTGPGLGLVGMRERVRALGGRLEIECAAGGGTRVLVSIPVQGT